MKEYDGFLEEKYLFYYYNALVLNYGKTDKNKSLETLNEASKNEIIKKIPAYTSFIYLNTAVLYFQMKKYSLAQKNISRLILQHDFVNLDTVFQFQIFVFELVLRIELNQKDILNEKITLLKKDFKKLIKSDQFSRESSLIDLIFEFCKGKEIEKKLSSFLDSYSNISNDRNTIIDYLSWVKNYFKSA